MIRYYLIITVFALLITSCKKDDSLTLEMFKNCPTIIPKEMSIMTSNESHAYIEGIFVNDSNIITIDIYDGKSYNLFDKKNGLLYKRFGNIGEGPNEIPMGCVGYLKSKNFYIFDDQNKIIAKYDIHSLLYDSLYSITPLAKYDIRDAQISRIIPLNDSVFTALGTYQDKYQYFIFNAKSEVLDYAIEIYNYNNSNYNKFHKFLSNQGSLAKHPKENKFVGSIRFSSNIDFFEVQGSQLIPIKSHRLGDPIYETLQQGKYNRVIPTNETVNGYIDLCATENYVYALFSNETFLSESYYSYSVIVYNWNGEAIKTIKLPQKAFYIAVSNDVLYTVTQEESGEFSIKAYNL